MTKCSEELVVRSGISAVGGSSNELSGEAKAVRMARLKTLNTR